MLMAARVERSGQGLVGLAERVALRAGAWSTGPPPRAAGWLLSAWLPLPVW
jgi:hypothetical protein